MDKYKYIKTIGDGSYGVVSKALIKGTRDFVAIKKLRQGIHSWDACSELPEVSILRKLNHANIIKLREVLHEDDDVYLVFDYMECSLIDFMERSPSSHPLIISFIRQAIEGLAYLHHSGYMHRDVKPENILISNDICKIGDFGCAKKTGCPKNTDRITTLWYRAPEILLRSTNYSPAIDMFAMGCIIAEIYYGRPLFPGSSEDDQLERITYLLGTPNNWKEGLILAKKCGYHFKRYPGMLLNEVFQAPRQAIRLMEFLLRWDPKERYTAVQALQHPFLSENAPGQRKLNMFPEQSRSAERVNNFSLIASPKARRLF